MATYTVTHLAKGQQFSRPSLLINEHIKHDRAWQHENDKAIEDFHRQLPDYGETKLHNLPSIASELGFGHVFVKDESSRFGLPSFKILGASWAVHRTLCRHLGLPPAETGFSDLKRKLAGQQDSKPTLISCTDGNWGRAVSRMVKYYAIPAIIYVPGFVNEYVRNLIRSEGAELRVLEYGSYDDTLATVQQEAKRTGALMVADVAFEGYEEIPRWVTEGYFTMLRETDRQVAILTGGKLPDICFASVGVGSWAHSVVEHYKSTRPSSKIITVEPEVAACLKESLHCGELTGIQTGETIMNGMCCGTPSTIAWPILRDGTFAAATVTDRESHLCVQELQAQSVNAGPCGAANLAALRKVCHDGIVAQEERSGKVVVLFSTEGRRDYDASQLT
jgi:diaminopropionate ammonia-lyase